MNKNSEDLNSNFNNCNINPDEEKLKGNSFFQKKMYKEAIECYTKSIEQSKHKTNCNFCIKDYDENKLSIYYSNRANCYLKLSKSKESLNDSDEAIKLNPSYNKAYFQRAQSLINLKFFKKAKEELKTLYDKFSQNKVDIDNFIKLAEEGILAEMPYKPDPKLSSWANSLTLKNQYEWLIDCYRMRQDDNYVWKGEFTGIYEPDATDIDVLKSFILFCKLAKAKKIIPVNWDWKDFIKIAQKSIKYAFEKSDAQEKYGSENVFAALMKGGRSLRHTAEMIYDVRICGDSENHDKKEILLGDKIEKELDLMKIRSLRDFKNYEKYFNDIGGVEIWVNFKF